MVTTHRVRRPSSLQQTEPLEHTEPRHGVVSLLRRPAAQCLERPDRSVSEQKGPVKFSSPTLFGDGGSDGTFADLTDKPSCAAGLAHPPHLILSPPEAGAGLLVWQPSGQAPPTRPVRRAFGLLPGGGGWLEHRTAVQRRQRLTKGSHPMTFKTEEGAASQGLYAYECVCHRSHQPTGP
ncbi:unnamed protein product [Protopolystoma xenopodis]|uniref:Uncharacterized protein n=1 Tax=Protopolystoma xenopodis TaxID=117903 RepID=A0A448WZ55_9PLAT|nr:unnamed protein product [Protopolystoma xenopodis]